MNSKFPASGFVVRYGTAALLVGAALALTLLIWAFVKPLASPLFLVAIMIAAWRGGLRAGIFATLLAGALIDYFFITPQYQLGGGLDDFARLSVFALEGFVLCWLIARRTAAEAEISDSREQLRALSLRQESLREDERRRIALEVHDELGQALTGVKMEIHTLKKQLEAAGCAAETNEKLKDLLGSIDGTIQCVRRIATELRPPILDDLGLAAAIEWQAREFERRAGIPCVLSTNADSVEFGSEFSIAVFRIFQETLTNITRHADAETIAVNLKKLDRKLILRVEDDGKGIEKNANGENVSLGIFGMRERARLIGGELEVFKGEPNGTVVLLTAPID